MKSENNIHEYGKVLEVLKVDRNGTQTVEMKFTCDRCSGNGTLKHLSHIDNGICYKCEGSKVMLKKIKIYTDSHWEKLETQREQRRQKELKEQAIKDAEYKRIEAEKEAQAQKSKDQYKALNKEFYSTLKSYMQHVKMDSWTKQFMKSILDLRLTQDIKDLSNNQKETLCDIVGKSSGRRNSKAYNEAAKVIASKMDYNFITEQEAMQELEA